MRRATKRLLVRLHIAVVIVGLVFFTAPVVGLMVVLGAPTWAIVVLGFLAFCWAEAKLWEGVKRRARRDGVIL